MILLIDNLEYVLLRLVKMYMKKSSDKNVLKMAPRWNSKLCTAELTNMAIAQISGSPISNKTVSSVTSITIKQINTSAILIPPIICVDIPKAKTVNLKRITANITRVVIPVIFTGLSFRPLIFVLISGNDESEFYTNLLKILSYTDWTFNIIQWNWIIFIACPDLSGFHRH